MIHTTNFYDTLITVEARDVQSQYIYVQKFIQHKPDPIELHVYILMNYHKTTF